MEKQPKFKVGDKLILPGDPDLRGCVCEVLSVDESGYTRLHHPDVEYLGYITGRTKHILDEYEARLLTPLELELL